MKQTNILLGVLLVLLCGVVRSQAQTGGKVYWGRAVNGVKAGASLEDVRASYVQGQRVTFKILLRNVTKKPIRFDTVGFVDTPFNWSVVTNMSAHQMSVARTLIVNGVVPAAITITLNPGETQTLPGSAPTFLLMGMGNTAYTEPVAIADPGNYLVRVAPLMPQDGRDSWVAKLVTGTVPLKLLVMPGNSVTDTGSKLSGQER